MIFAIIPAIGIRGGCILQRIRSIPLMAGTQGIGVIQDMAMVLEGDPMPIRHPDIQRGIAAINEVAIPYATIVDRELFQRAIPAVFNQDEKPLQGGITIYHELVFPLAAELLQHLEDVPQRDPLNGQREDFLLVACLEVNTHPAFNNLVIGRREVLPMIGEAVVPQSEVVNPEV
jgi:hypothetical protein